MQEKKASDELAALRVELDHKKWEVEKMESRYNLQGAAQLKYEVIPQLEKRIAHLVAAQVTTDEAGPTLLPSLLGAEQIAAVVSRYGTALG